METNIDWKLFYRLDLGILLDFLSSTAGVLLQNNIIAQSDADELRVNIRNIQNQVILQDQSILSLFNAEENRFVRILQHRYGNIGLNLNVARVSLRPIVHEMKQTLAELGDVLLAKSQLLFNRTINVHTGGVFQRQTLLASLIVDICEEIHQAVRTVEGIEQILYQMLPADLSPYTETDEELDLTMVRALGFRTIVAEPTPYTGERKINQAMSQLLLGLTDQLSSFLQVCQSSDLKFVKPTVASTCGWLRAEATRLSLISYPDTDDFDAWELRRQNYNSTVTIINLTLKKLSHDLTEGMVVGAMAATGHSYMAKSMLRCIISDLVARGMHVNEAESAAQLLNRYCQDNKITPTDILPEEFSHIHPRLSKECLAQAAQGLKGSEHKSSHEKHRLNTRIKALKQSFQSVLNQNLLALLLLIITQVSCGLKTMPKSDEPDLRPELPLKPEAIKLSAVPPKPGEKPTRGKRDVPQKDSADDANDETEKPKEDKGPAQLIPRLGMPLQ